MHEILCYITTGQASSIQLSACKPPEACGDTYSIIESLSEIFAWISVSTTNNHLHLSPLKPGFSEVLIYHIMELMNVSDHCLSCRARWWHEYDKAGLFLLSSSGGDWCHQCQRQGNNNCIANIEICMYCKMLWTLIFAKYITVNVDKMITLYPWFLLS